MNYKSWEDIAVCLNERQYDLTNVAIMTDYYDYTPQASAQDSYLNSLAVWLTYNSSVQVVIKKPLPGWLNYVRSLGFGSHVSTVEVSADSPLITHHFDWDILQGKKSITNFPQPWYINPILRFDIQQKVDSKEILKRWASSGFVPSIKGSVIDHISQLKEISHQYSYPLYLKKIRGSGGNEVRHVLEEEILEDAVHDLFGKLTSDKLPEPLIIEPDVMSCHYGKRVIGNYCISGIIGSKDYRIVGITKQLVLQKQTHVEWIGSEKAVLTSVQEKELIRGFKRVVNCVQAHGYVGPIGADVFLLHHHGRERCAFFDINARFPISFFSCLVGHVFGYKHWININ